MNLFDVLARYQTRRLLGKTANTEAKHRRAIRRLGEYLGRIPTLDDLTDDNIAAVLARVLADGKSAHTANDYRAKLCAIWTFAAKRGLVYTFPDIDRLAAPQSAPVAWSREELSAVFAATEHATEPICGIPGPLWMRSLLAVLWDTGERVGAIMRASHADLRGDTLHVPAINRKGKTRDMVYSLHPDTLSLIAGMREHYTGPSLFPVDTHGETIPNRFRRCLRLAGLPSDRKHLFHCIRRSVASHAAATGADASRLLDHSSSAVTRAFYIDPRLVPGPRAVDVLFRP